jgi:hypothetical protein
MSHHQSFEKFVSITSLKELIFKKWNVQEEIETVAALIVL